jgi:hypothetical protein
VKSVYTERFDTKFTCTEPERQAEVRQARSEEQKVRSTGTFILTLNRSRRIEKIEINYFSEVPSVNTAAK